MLYRDGRCHLFLGAVAGGEETAEGLIEALQLTRLGVVGQQRTDFGFVGQDVVDKALERPLGADFHKGANAFPVEGFDALDPLHRRGNLQLENILDALHRRRIEVAGDIGHQRQPRRADGEPVEDGPQGFAGMGHDLGMEGVADGDAHGPEALLFKEPNGLFDGLGGAPHHTLGVGVDVGGDDVAVHLLDRRLDDTDWRHDGSHPAVVVVGNFGHFRTAGGRGFQRMGERHDARRNQRGVFTERMAHHHVGVEAKLAQELVEAGVHGEHGGLGDGGLHEVAVGFLQRSLVAGIDKDIRCERLAEDGGHHGVGFGEGLGDDRLAGGQLAPHIDILAALPREEEGELARLGAAAAIDALGLQRLPGGRVVKAQRFARFVHTVKQFGMGAKINKEALGGGDFRTGWQLGLGHPPAFDLDQQLVQPVFQGGRCGGGDGKDAAQGPLVDGKGRRSAGRGGSRRRRQSAAAHGRGRDGSGCKDLGFRLEHAGDMFFHHQMEIGAAKAVGADAGTARRTLGLLPRPGVIEQVEGRIGQIEVGIRCGRIERRRQHLVV